MRGRLAPPRARARPGRRGRRSRPRSRPAGRSSRRSRGGGCGRRASPHQERLDRGRDRPCSPARRLGQLARCPRARRPPAVRRQRARVRRVRPESRPPQRARRRRSRVSPFGPATIAGTAASPSEPVAIDVCRRTGPGAPTAGQPGLPGWSGDHRPASASKDAGLTAQPGLARAVRGLDERLDGQGVGGGDVGRTRVGRSQSRSGRKTTARLTSAGGNSPKVCQRPGQSPASERSVSRAVLARPSRPSGRHAAPRPLRSSLPDSARGGRRYRAPTQAPRSCSAATTETASSTSAGPSTGPATASSVLDLDSDEVPDQIDVVGEVHDQHPAACLALDARHPDARGPRIHRSSTTAACRSRK